MRTPTLAALPFALIACTPTGPDAVGSPPTPERAIIEAPPVVAPPCARRADHPALQPLDPTGAGAAVVLARSGDRSIAFVADEDSAAIHTVDLDAHTTLTTTSLTGRPAQLLITPDGRIIAALRDHHALEILEPAADPAAPLLHRCLVETPAEPVALAHTPDGATLLAVSRWGHALSAFSLDASSVDATRPRFTVDLPRDPAALAVAEDGSRAFVLHAVGGRLSVIDLPGALTPPRALALQADLRRGDSARAPRMRPAGQGFALVRGRGGRLFAPVVITEQHPVLDSWALYAGTTWEAPSVSSEIATLDAASERITLEIKAPFGAKDCLLPRAAALDDDRGELLVACLGRDEIIAYDARAEHPHAHLLRRWKVAPGPRGVAIDRQAKRAVVWSQFDGVLSVIVLGGEEGDKAPVPVAIPIAAHRALPPDLDRGRKLFHEANGGRIAFDGRACASCHLDGRDDGLTWLSIRGEQQTPMLLGRLPDTAPYGWHGGERDLATHFITTLARLGGRRISAKERDALFAWVQSLTPPAEPTRPVTAQIERGEAIFMSKETGCSSCHLGEETTDHARHDVRTGLDSWSSGFDTPSLRFISHSAPYLHDGRYGTIAEVLTGMDGKMGHTRQLSVEDREALIGYVESL